jgi:hypothetical protein
MSDDKRVQAVAIETVEIFNTDTGTSKLFIR